MSNEVTRNTRTPQASTSTTPSTFQISLGLGAQVLVEREFLTPDEWISDLFPPALGEEDVIGEEEEVVVVVGTLLPTSLPLPPVVIEHGTVWVLSLGGYGYQAALMY